MARASAPRPRLGSRDRLPEASRSSVHGAVDDAMLRADGELLAVPLLAPEEHPSSAVSVRRERTSPLTRCLCQNYDVDAAALVEDERRCYRHGPGPGFGRRGNRTSV